MPLEYVLTGRSMKSPISANSSMAGSCARISRFDNPWSAALKRAFSRPVNSGWNPAPRSSSAATRPSTSTAPAVGRRMRAASCRDVLLPEPFAPMMQSVSPAEHSKETSRRAQNSALARRRRGQASSRNRSEGRE